MTTETKTTHYLIVDTNSYSGNFERESIAFATGLVGECMVGEELAEKAKEDMSVESVKWWRNYGRQTDDGEGCLRPAFIWPTPGFFNHGMGGNFPDNEEGEREGLAHYKKVATGYHQQELDRLNTIVVGQGNWTPQSLEAEKTRRRDELEKIKHMTKPNKHDCYQSVGIVVDEIPPLEVLDEFKDRMTFFLKEKGVEVLGFALESKTVEIKVSKSPRMRF